MLGEGRLDRGQFPAEVGRVLESGVHALAAGLGVDVRGVTGQEHATHPVGGRLALTAMLRVGATNQGGAERMQGIFRDQLMPVARQACPDPEQAPARAGLVASQLLGLALTRYVLHFPPTVALAREEVVAWLGPTVQRYPTAPSP